MVKFSAGLVQCERVITMTLKNSFWISRSQMVPPNRFSLFSQWRNFNIGSNWYTSV